MQLTRAAPEVLVIGGGAIGCSIARELVCADVETLLIERETELARGCSAGPAGFLTVGHSVPLATPESLRLGLRWLLRPDSPFYLRPRPDLLPWLARFVLAARPARAAAGTRLLRQLSAASLRLHAALAGEGLDTGFTHRGILKVYETEKGMRAARASAASPSCLFNADVLGPTEVRQLEPALANDVAGAVYYPDEAHCDSVRFTNAVARDARERGATLCTGVEALRLRVRQRRIVEVDTTAGPIRPGTVVLSAGVWSPGLGASAGIGLPIEGGKGYHVEFDPVGRTPEIPVLLTEARVGITPLPGRVRFSGTLELAGLDDRVDSRRLSAVVAAGQRALPELYRRPPRQVWRGLRPCTPDGLPLLGRSDPIENLIVATGHSHLGLVLAPITAELTRQITLGERTDHEFAPLSPARFRSLSRHER